jgi:hypothetical protein
MDDPKFVAYVIDPGCDCCSYLPRATFDSEDEAKRWVAESRDPSNYVVEEW